MKNPIRTPLFILSLFLLAGTALSGHLDNGQGPVGLVPSVDTASPGSQVTFTVTLSGVTTTDQVVNMSTSNPELSLPSTMTVTAGNSVGYVTGTVSSSATSGSLTVTAYANNDTASCGLTVARSG